MKTPARLLAAVALLVLLAPAPAHAYIGPGAGMALGGSVLAVFMAVCSAVVLLFTWPVRFLFRLAFRKKPPARAKVRRVVILGLDGLDPGLTEQFLEEGKLPHLAALRDQGSFHRLGTTLPPISPVAWSSFQTGSNPGKHNIFDFIIPDRRTYQPKMSSVEIRPPRRHLRLGKYQIPLGKASVRLLRKSKPFWNFLGEYGIFSSVLRVPITFPPERLNGVLLSAMCAPDLRGTQGVFSFYTSHPGAGVGETGGEVYPLVRAGHLFRGELVGPQNPFRGAAGVVKVPFTVAVKDATSAVLKVGGVKHRLRSGEYTGWVPVRFRLAPGFAVHGVCKFLLLGTQPELKLYVTPVNIDPERPVMPVSHPAVYSVYLAKRQGTYATLGLAEDTSGLNARVLRDGDFLRQCLDNDAEREAMFFDALDKTPRGLCVCVFDGTDRMQHMFWRYIDDGHPARPADPPAEHAGAIEDLYRRMDDLVGRTMAKCNRDDTLLMVLSDHGFNSFRHGVDLNLWLQQHGYLAVHEGRGGEDFLAGVDWSRTRAFALGLAGIFLNIKGKYEQGIVEPGEEADQLRAEIAAKLAELTDPATGARPVRRAYIAGQVYRGPYKDEGPDLVVGYSRGYRVSWDTAIGRVTDRVIHANTKAWSGDHCIDPALVPGVLFCNRPVESANPRLMDIGPTVLEHFGVPVPDYMDGKPLTIGSRKSSPARPRQPAPVEVS